MSTYYAGIRSTLQIQRAEYKKQVIIFNFCNIHQVNVGKHTKTDTHFCHNIFSYLQYMPTTATSYFLNTNYRAWSYFMRL